MRASLERFARSWWAGELGALGAGLHVLAAPLAWAWSAAGAARSRRLTGRSVWVEGLAVVSVGNLAVGGTGKTPVAAWVARQLCARGLPTSILTGEHGRDEALLHERWNPHVPVVADRDRVAAAREALAVGARAVVLDDGFQHLSLARDLDLVLLSADDAFPGPVLPRGPYREPVEALRRADVIVVTRRVASEEVARAVGRRAKEVAPRAVTAGLRMAPGALVALDAWVDAGSSRGAPTEAADGANLRGGPVLAVCGVGRPEAFRCSVRELVGGDVELLAFQDHHPFTAMDASLIQARANGRPIVLTEKDAVKLARCQHAMRGALVLLEEPVWGWGEAEVRGALEALAEERVGR